MYGLFSDSGRSDSQIPLTSRALARSGPPEVRARGVLQGAPRVAEEGRRGVRVLLGNAREASGLVGRADVSLLWADCLEGIS